MASAAHEGCSRVEGRVLVREDGLFVAMLRFEPGGTIHEHPGPNDTIVVCLEGRGLTSVAGEVAPICAGEEVRWPGDVPHRLWTEDEAMVTLMVERPAWWPAPRATLTPCAGHTSSSFPASRPTARPSRCSARSRRR